MSIIIDRYFHQYSIKNVGAYSCWQVIYFRSQFFLEGGGWNLAYVDTSSTEIVFSESLRLPNTNTKTNTEDQRKGIWRLCTWNSFPKKFCFSQEISGDLIQWNLCLWKKPCELHHLLFKLVFASNKTVGTTVLELQFWKEKSEGRQYLIVSIWVSWVYPWIECGIEYCMKCSTTWPGCPRCEYFQHKFA